MRVDGEPASGIVRKAVGDRIGAVRVGCEGGHADDGADRRVLVDGIGAGIDVGDCADAAVIIHRAHVNRHDHR